MIVLLTEEVVLRRWEDRSGEGLKYPAVKVQDEIGAVGLERSFSIVVRTGSSVDVSGCRTGVSWVMGKIIVSVCF